jgi:purine-binding chemotaxis protein CheW
MNDSDAMTDDQEQMSAAEDVKQLVCFKLADEEYAVEIIRVQEVNRVQKITPVPQMPAFVLGVVNIRGSVVPVFDLRVKFGLPQKEFDKKTKILVITVDTIFMSFIVDEILDNIKLENAQIDPAPNVKMKISKECLSGVGLQDNRMIVILDLDKINEEINADIEKHRIKETNNPSEKGVV